jgi:hypothetical protein
MLHSKTTGNPTLRFIRINISICTKERKLHFQCNVIIRNNFSKRGSEHSLLWGVNPDVLTECMCNVDWHII